MQYASAEVLQNMDTPVNWSYSAIFSTIMDLYGDTDPTYGHKYMLAEKLFYKYYDEKQAVSARWICENYITFAREEGLTVYNCNDIITKIIDKHNRDVELGTRLKSIDKLQPATSVYWNPTAITRACKKHADIYEEKMREITQQTEMVPDWIATDWANAAYKNCIDIKYDFNLYTTPCSINELVDYCKGFMFKTFWGHDLSGLCYSWVDDVIDYHNEHVIDTQKISGGVK